MSPIATIVLMIALLLVFSQFGNQLAGRMALLWWLVGGFLTVAAIDPEFFRPVAAIFGVKFISNFVLAGMVLFLLAMCFQLTANLTDSRRKMRRLVATQSAHSFVNMRRMHALQPKQAKALVILPCYNEEKSLQPLFAPLKQLQDSGAVDFCFINDGSLDRSAYLLQQNASREAVHLPVNIGVGGVLLCGFIVAKELSYDYVIQCDSDGQHPIDEIQNLLHAAEQRAADLLIGSRYLNHEELESSSAVGTTASRVLGTRLLGVCLKTLGFGKITDPTSGFRVYSRRAYEQLILEMPDEYPEPESVAILATHQLKIAEIPVRMNPRFTGRSSITGLGPIIYMIKVSSSLLGMRLRAALGQS